MFRDRVLSCKQEVTGEHPMTQCFAHGNHTNRCLISLVGKKRLSP
jgi:hypothetical protein